jgi:GTP-binding protein HflX
MGSEVVSSLIVPVRQENPATLIGQGKAEELKRLCEEQEIQCIVFDHDLSPRHQRNLEEATGLCVIDRQEVILQIFANRAMTREAVLQVGLARLQYSLPRLTRKWTNLSQQKGGVKGTKGEGETQLELDRRVVLHRIDQLKQELAKVEEQRQIQRKSRREGSLPIGAIVGYTNSGKSSLLKALAGADILVEDKLFATLDPTTRKVKLSGGYEILLSDTVGFVSDLPHHLVDAFKSTLDETKDADFLIIVCDASHPDMLACYNTTIDVLRSLDCAEKPTIVMVNKMDACLEQFAVARLKSMVDGPFVETSVTNRQGLEDLEHAIEDVIHRLRPNGSYLIPNDRHDLVAWIRRNGTIESIDYEEDGVHVVARLSGRNEAYLSTLIPKR